MGILDSIVEWIATQVMNLLDLITGSVLGALGCDMSTFLRYFPAAETLYEIFVAIGVGFILLNLVWQLFRNFGLGLGLSAEDPVKLAIKSILFIFLALFADQIMVLVLGIVGTPYDWVVDTALPPIEFASFASVVTVLVGSLVSGSVSLIVLILVLIVAWNYSESITEAYVASGAGIPTDTLLTKIMLGTVGCVPAYDRYFKKALADTGAAPQVFSAKSIRTLGNLYLKLNRPRDVIELPINDVLDINGWDVEKALKLLHKSNPTVFEWFSSPIVYQTTDFTEAFKPVMRRYFSSKSGLWHYLQMAEGNYREYLRGDMVKAKKYFYVLRPILACRWILEKGTPPPMLFSELAASQLPDYLEKTVAKLLDLKMNSPEVKMIPRIDILNAYMDRSIAEVRALVEQYPREITKDWEELNALFLAALEM